MTNFLIITYHTYGAELEINARPMQGLDLFAAWWETCGFRGAMVMLVTGLIYGGFRRRIKIIKDQKRRLEIMANEKTRDLDERVKELGCLYGISKLVEKEYNIEEILHGTATLTPPAWRYPEITHNFNNILAAIIGYAEMVKKEMPENIKAYKYIGRVLGSAHRATDLVRQIMVFSKQKDSPKAPYSPDGLLHEVLDSIRNSIHKDIKIVGNISADIGNINLAHPCSERLLEIFA